MSRTIINVIVGIFVLVLLIVALVQNAVSWQTGILGFAVGLMLVVIFPWHSEGSLSRPVMNGLKWLGAAILLVLLVVGIATDWTARETALMGIAAGAAVAAALQTSTRNKA